MDYGEDALKIDALFTRSPQISREYTRKRSEHNSHELTHQEVRILLEFTTNQSVGEAEIIAKTLQKQMILQRRNMFDPGRYFGMPQIESLDNAYDRRIQEMFSTPSNYRSETNLQTLIKQKTPMSGIAHQLKKNLNKTQKLCLNTFQKTKLVKNFSPSISQKILIQPQYEPIITMKIATQNKENIQRKINRSSSNRVSPKKIDNPTPLQRVRLKIKSNCKLNR